MKTNTFKTKRKQQLLFYTALVALPVIQFFVMYVGVNLRSVLFAFQKYEAFTGEYLTSFAYVKENVQAVFKNLFGNGLNVDLTYAWRNTLISYALTWVNMLVGLIAGFFIYKKFFLAGYFRIVLYLPNVVSGFIMIFGYRYFVERGLPLLFPDNELFTEMGGLIANPKTAFWALSFYSVWTGFGSGLLLTTGQMSRTDKEVLEAAKLDGVNLWQEFRHIVWPVMYPVTTIGIYTGITGLFLAGPPTFAFWNTNAPPELYTFGYYMFTLVLNGEANYASYPMNATLGLCFTLVAAPMVFGLKALFEKHDPNN